MFSRSYLSRNETVIVATINVGELVQVDGNDECSCRLVVQGFGVDYDMTVIGIDQIQAFENAILLLHTLEEKEQLRL